LFIRFFYRFTARCALFVFKELHLAASSVLALYHERFPANAAFIASGKSLSAAVRADHRQGPATTRAERIAALDLF